MMKNTSEFSQFTDAVVCRECTLPRDEETLEPKGRIQGNTKIGPVLEVATCCLQERYCIEIRIMSLNRGGYRSWVGISRGLNVVGHGFGRRRAGNLGSAVRRICVKIECG